MKTKRLVSYYAATLAIFVSTLLSLPLYAGLSLAEPEGRDGGGGYHYDRSEELLKRAQQELLNELANLKSTVFDSDPSRKDIVREGLENLKPLTDTVGPVRDGKPLMYNYNRDSRPFKIMVYQQFFSAHAGFPPELYAPVVKEIKRRLLRETAHLWKMDDEVEGRNFALETYPVDSIDSSKVHSNICDYSVQAGQNRITFKNLTCDGSSYGAYRGYEEYLVHNTYDATPLSTRVKLRADAICNSAKFLRAESYSIKGTSLPEGKKYEMSLYPLGDSGWSLYVNDYTSNLKVYYEGKIFDSLICTNVQENESMAGTVVNPPSKITKYWLAISADQNSKIQESDKVKLVDQKALEICMAHGFNKYLGGADIKEWAPHRFENDADDLTVPKKYYYVEIYGTTIGSVQEMKPIKIHTTNLFSWAGWETGMMYYPTLISNVRCEQN